ncbi:MAG: hypothetical protein IJ690_06170 [Clostridia bacterium]|nr:hypothetical protein [Clostridia bacterium]
MNKDKRNKPPTNIDMAVERAVATKNSLNELFVREFLSQIARFLDNCNPCWLAEISGKPIRIQPIYSKGSEHVARIKMRVKIGELGFTISPLDLIEDAFNDYFSKSAFSVTPGNFYAGLENAYNTLITRIEKGESISGLAIKKKIIGKSQLILNLK